MNDLYRVYLVRCSDNSLYCGVAKDVARRVQEHNAGKGCKYTRTRWPVTLAGTSREMPKGEALSMEHWIKSLPPQRKLAVLLSHADDPE